MVSNDDELIAVNQAITDAENAGDWTAMEPLIAANMAFRRADGSIIDRRTFFDALKPGGNRILHNCTPLIVSENRAVVRCIIKVGDADYDNLRLFVRVDGKWQLLGWANEAG
jgi:Domain of unknown function (DUF4440)